MPPQDLSLFVAHGVIPRQKPTIASIASTDSQFQLARGTARRRAGKILKFACAVVWMGERAGRLGLPPFVKTNPGIVECNAIGMQTFAVGSVHRNELRREVQ